MRALKAILAVALFWLANMGATVTAAPASGPLAARAQELVALLNGTIEPAAAMSPDMLKQLPAAQISASFAQIRAAHGKAVAVESVDAQSASSALATVRTEKARLRLRLAIEPQAPHRLIGLLVEGLETLNDSTDSVVAELGRLPGEVTLSVAALGDGAPRSLAARKPDQALAIGSTFKLFILGELVRQIRAGERSWSDVVPLAHRSLPSGILQDWPAGSPMTIHSLAALMISRSDNSATDTLLHLIGREKVEQALPALGIKAPRPRVRPCRPSCARPPRGHTRGRRTYGGAGSAAGAGRG